MLFLKEKSTKVIISLLKGPKYISKLARECDVSFPYVKQLIDLLSSKNIVEIKKEGKKSFVKLTEKGERMANLINSIYELENNE